MQSDTPAMHNILIVKQPVTIGDSNNNINNKETYMLNINDENITIISESTAGAFYAFQTLKKLTVIDGNDRVLPSVNITDGPRYGYRGMHLDVSRNFHSKSQVLSLLDAMAMYKLNKMHFHLADDEGWRLEIPGLPELTEVHIVLNDLNNQL